VAGGVALAMRADRGGKAVSTKRTPIGRPQKSKITPAVVEAFKQMEMARHGCTCSPDRWAIGGDYDACEEWWAAHSDLHDLLGLKPWRWPCIRHPDTKNPWPAGSYKAKKWRPNLKAQNVYRQIEAAAKVTT
jgi:hypothetical protein